MKIAEFLENHFSGILAAFGGLIIFGLLIGG